MASLWYTGLQQLGFIIWVHVDFPWQRDLFFNPGKGNSHRSRMDGDVMGYSMRISPPTELGERCLPRCDRQVPCSEVPGFVRASWSLFVWLTHSGIFVPGYCMYGKCMIYIDIRMCTVCSIDYYTCTY